MSIRVLFLCTGNSARSQIAEALLRHIGRDAFEVHSAGTEPRESITPLARETLDELGIPYEGQHPKDLAQYVGQSFDYVITLCDRVNESCPSFPGAELIHWSFPDPSAIAPEEAPKAFHDIAVSLERRIRLLIAVESKPD
ncbi:MAG: arsenate reductase ArsC [Polyangiales bacterium]